MADTLRRLGGGLEVAPLEKSAFVRPQSILFEMDGACAGPAQQLPWSAASGLCCQQRRCMHACGHALCTTLKCAVGPGVHTARQMPSRAAEHRAAAHMAAGSSAGARRRGGSVPPVPFTACGTPVIRPPCFCCRLPAFRAGKPRRWDMVESHPSVACLLYHRERQAVILVRWRRHAGYSFQLV